LLLALLALLLRISFVVVAAGNTQLPGMRSAPKVTGWIASLHCKAKAHHPDRLTPCAKFT
jgi:hypothetical protein